MGMANTFGARLILARNEKGLSQFTLAEMLGCLRELVELARAANPE